MLLASDFILNGPVVAASSYQEEDGKRPLSISPWLLETRNVHAAKDPLRVVQIPDVDPFELVASNRPNCDDDDDDDEEDTLTHDDDDGEDRMDSAETETKMEDSLSPEAAVAAPEPTSATRSADFSMAAGDFSSIYSVDSEAAAWDCVVACFFLDASPSIIEYLQVVLHMLKPGGLLISFGPLHWHWSGPAMMLQDTSVPDYHERYSYLDPKYLHSVDFCWEDIQQILINLGFEMLETEMGIPALYTADVKSMQQSEYRCVHLVARKKGAPSAQSETKTKDQQATANTNTKLHA
jgi:N2227-like protein